MIIIFPGKRAFWSEHMERGAISTGFWSTFWGGGGEQLPLSLTAWRNILSPKELDFGVQTRDKADIFCLE